MGIDASASGEQPAQPGGRRPGDFFVLQDGATVAWRWDPGVAQWVRWYVPVPSPTKDKRIKGWGRALSALGYEPVHETTTTLHAPTGAAPTASTAVAAEYTKSIEKYRDSVKWFVVAAGAVAVALIGTAPLSGAGVALNSSASNEAAHGLFQALGAVAIILVVTAWILQPLEMSLPYLAKRPSLGFWPLWKWKLQREYREHWSNLLDARATSLEEYQDYRNAWLGTLSDIDRLSLGSSRASRTACLDAYKTAAEARSAEDTANIGLILKRGISNRTRRRGQVAMFLIAILSIVAARGYITYLAGSGQPPIITSFTAAPQPPTVGARVVLSVQASGSGFSYTWWHLPGTDPIPRAYGPQLVIPRYSDVDAGTYRVRVMAGDGATADVQELTLAHVGGSP